MKNPYEVLGINENATQDEIKHAYRELVKKYHPDKYADNPLKDLAEEKMRDINEAYDYLMKSGGNTSGYKSNTDGQYSSSEPGSGEFNEVRQAINRNDIKTAETILNSISSQNAEWFFLHGMISLRKGWYSGAYQDIQRAVNMDPSNFEYRQVLNQLNSSHNTYSNTYYNTRGNSESDELCKACTCLFCSDQCCELTGGNIGCC